MPIYQCWPHNIQIPDAIIVFLFSLLTIKDEMLWNVLFFRWQSSLVSCLVLFICVQYGRRPYGLLYSAGRDVGHGGVWRCGGHLQLCEDALLATYQHDPDWGENFSNSLYAHVIMCFYSQIKKLLTLFSCDLEKQRDCFFCYMNRNTCGHVIKRPAEVNVMPLVFIQTMCYSCVKPKAVIIQFLSPVFTIYVFFSKQESKHKAPWTLLSKKIFRNI